MPIPQFEPFDKIPRLNRDIVITEKIDGTNAQIFIENVLPEEYVVEEGVYADNGFCPGLVTTLRAGSRSRFLTRKTDNAGFCNWAFDHAEELIRILGPGRHFGEWWGKGIQRGYDMDKKVFSLFNTHKWEGIREIDGTLRCVPILHKGDWHTNLEGFAAEFWPDLALDSLATYGSMAAPGYMNPEGIVVYHTAGNLLFKATIKNDEKHKGES